MQRVAKISVVLAWVFGAMLCMSLLLNCASLAVLGTVAGGAEPMTASGLPEEVVEEGQSQRRLAEVFLVGVIGDDSESGPFGGPPTHGELLQQLAAARDDDSVAGVLVRIDSPGGGVTASDEFHHIIEQISESKPVVIHMGDLCASGGYYAAVAGDHLVASPTTILGSIGVILPLINAAGLMEKIGLQSEAITTGPYKDMTSPTRGLKPAEQEILQGTVDAMHARFVQLVAAGRSGRGPVPADEAEAAEHVAGWADGRIMHADLALELGMVDAIGYRDEALAVLREKAGSPNGQVFRYAQTESLGSLLGLGPVQIQVAPQLPESQALYQWRP
jgi:protease-4